MSVGTKRVTKGELDELLNQAYQGKEIVGYLVSWGDDCDNHSQSQVLLLDKTLTTL